MRATQATVILGLRGRRGAACEGVPGVVACGSAGVGSATERRASGLGGVGPAPRLPASPGAGWRRSPTPLLPGRAPAPKIRSTGGRGWQPDTVPSTWGCHPTLPRCLASRRPFLTARAPNTPASPSPVPSGCHAPQWPPDDWFGSA